jgi:opacity protein-like surface antigen
MKRIAAFAFAIAAAALPVQAADFTSLNALSQDEFHRLAEDLGAAFSYKGVTPATALGPIGFDIGIEVTDTRMQNSALFALAGAGSHSHLVVPKLHVNKGLFDGLDIGAFVGGTGDVSAALLGIDLRYAILEDSLAMPAVAFRLSGTRATGLGDLRIGTAAADVMVSKAFVWLTPYVGAGVARVQAKASGTTLAEEKFNRGRVFGGLNVNLVGVNVALEAEKSGDNTSISAKVGMRF